MSKCEAEELEKPQPEKPVIDCARHACHFFQQALKATDPKEKTALRRVGRCFFQAVQQYQSLNSEINAKKDAITYYLKAAHFYQKALEKSTTSQNILTSPYYAAGLAWDGVAKETAYPSSYKEAHEYFLKSAEVFQQEIKLFELNPEHEFMPLFRAQGRDLFELGRKYFECPNEGPRLEQDVIQPFLTRIQNRAEQIAFLVKEIEPLSKALESTGVDEKIIEFKPSVKGVSSTPFSNDADY